jgi:hypothetical protein
MYGLLSRFDQLNYAFAVVTFDAEGGKHWGRKGRGKEREK